MALKKAETLSDLAAILECPPSIITYTIYKTPKDQLYKRFTIPKKSGGFREISAPIQRLKDIQDKLNVVLTECMNEIEDSGNSRFSFSHGFRKKHSIVTNGQPHKQKKYVLNIDLHEFFPSINFGRVRGFFIKNKNFQLNPRIATILAQIICHENKLPQGSPCSPIVSNLLGHILDVRLAKIAKNNNCFYSRYADDITFSSSLKKFPPNLARTKFWSSSVWQISKPLEDAINKYGFIINFEKTRLQLRTSRQTVTGLVVNKKVNISADYYRVVRSMCHSLFRTGHFYHVIEREKNESSKNVFTITCFFAALLKKILPNSFFTSKKTRVTKNVIMAESGTMLELEGMLSHIYYVKKFYYSRVKKSHNDRIQKSHNTFTLKDKQGKSEDKFSGIKRLYFKFLFYKYFYGLDKPTILCEGKTDYTYLRCAFKSLYKNFPELIKISNQNIKYLVKFFNYSEINKEILGIKGGTGDLANLIRNYKNNLKFYGPGKKYPVIILTDNDKGADDIFKAVKEVTGKEITSRNQNFYFVIENLYVIATPRKVSNQDSRIEDFFDQSVLSTKIDGKIFNPDNSGNDNSTEYGKNIFAEKVIKKKQKSINFKEFEKILFPICEVLNDYQNRI